MKSARIMTLMKASNKLADQIQRKLDRKKKIDDRIKTIQGRCNHNPMPPGKDGIVSCGICGADITPAKTIDLTVNAPETSIAPPAPIRLGPPSVAPETH